MSAPKFAPTPVLDVTRVYGSPDVAPASWTNDRPTDIEGFQPAGDHLGYQGPDQGYALLLANRLRSRLQLLGGVSSDDAVRGCLNIALRRASLFSRAPVIHDLTIAFTIWGFWRCGLPVREGLRSSSGIPSGKLSCCSLGSSSSKDLRISSWNSLAF